MRVIGWAEVFLEEAKQLGHDPLANHYICNSVICAELDDISDAVEPFFEDELVAVLE